MVCKLEDTENSGLRVFHGDGRVKEGMMMRVKLVITEERKKKTDDCWVVILSYESRFMNN